MNSRFFGSIEQPGDLQQLQHRILEAFALLTGVLMIFLGISDYLVGLSKFIVVAKLIFSLPFLLGFVMMRRYGFYQSTVHWMLIFGFIAIAINYLNNEGYKGPTTYTIFIFIVAITILIKGKVMYFWLIFAFLLYSTLFYGEVRGWYTIEPQYRDAENLFWDHWVTLLWTGMFVFFGIYIFVSKNRQQNESLKQIQKEKDIALAELESLNLKKNQLLAVLSHDLRSPIGTLSQTLELAEQDSFEKNELELIFSDLKSQSFHLNKVLNNTLEWVLAELEDKESELTTTKPSDLLLEMKKIMQVQASRKQQQIVTIEHGIDSPVALELNEIKIILKNLLDNAIKFSPVGSKIDLISTRVGDDLRWEVKNEWQESEPLINHNLFEFKVKTSFGTEREKGTGLGLPLCKKIADKLEMKLGVETVNGHIVFFLSRKIS
jgi:two-component system, sensor histidine kinase and response regulator